MTAMNLSAAAMSELAAAAELRKAAARRAERLAIATDICVGWAHHGSPIRIRTAWEMAVGLASLADASRDAELRAEAARRSPVSPLASEPDETNDDGAQ